MPCTAKIASCFQVCPGAVQLRKLVAAGEMNTFTLLSGFQQRAASEMFFLLRERGFSGRSGSIPFSVRICLDTAVDARGYPELFCEHLGKIVAVFKAALMGDFGNGIGGG